MTGVCVCEWNESVAQITSLAKQLEQTASSKEWLESQVLSLQNEMGSMGAASSTAPAGMSPSKAEVMACWEGGVGCAFHPGRVFPRCLLLGGVGWLRIPS